MSDFEEVYRETALIPVVILYSPTRERCVILQHGMESLAFWNLISAIDYARGKGWLSISQAHDALETANEKIFYYDRRQDLIEDQFHVSYNRSRLINSVLREESPVTPDESVFVSVLSSMKNIFRR